MMKAYLKIGLAIIIISSIIQFGCVGEKNKASSVSDKSENKEDNELLGDDRGELTSNILTLEISGEDFIRSLAGNFRKDDAFVKVIELVKEYQTNSQDDFVTLFYRAFTTLYPDADLAALFHNYENKDIISRDATNEEVLSVIRAELENAIENTLNVLKYRMENFDIEQPDIEYGTSTNQILVDMSGVKDKDRLRNLLQRTAHLEFWETYDINELWENLVDVNAKIKELEDAAGDNPEEANVLSDETQGVVDFPLFKYLNPNITNNGESVGSGPVIGYAEPQDTARINGYFAIRQVKALLPRNVKVLWTAKSVNFGSENTKEYFQLIAIKVSNRDGRSPLEGDVITNARQEFGQNQTSEVSMKMNSDGSQLWAQITRDNIGRSLAIVIDDYVYSFPKVISEIKGGRTSISGDFSIDEAKDLANVFRSGKLPVPVRIIDK